MCFGEEGLCQIGGVCPVFEPVGCAFDDLKGSIDSRCGETVRVAGDFVIEQFNISCVEPGGRKPTEIFTTRCGGVRRNGLAARLLAQVCLPGVVI